jgi:hypothetical protein
VDAYIPKNKEIQNKLMTNVHQETPTPRRRRPAPAPDNTAAARTRLLAMPVDLGVLNKVGVVAWRSVSYAALQDVRVSGYHK